MGLLSALGGLFPNDDGTPNGLQRFGDALNPQDALSQQKVMEQQGALSALAGMRNKGIINPQQILNTLAQYNPEYAEKAADIQAKNPLAALLQGSNNSQAGGGVPLASLTGDDLLSSLPPGIASQVKGYSEGKLQPSPYLMRSPQGQQLMQLVSQYDPSFDAVNYQARAATRKDFTSGKSAQNITALNTAIGHISTLQDAANALDNTSYPTVNSVVNWAKNVTGSSEIKDFDTAKDAVADELTRVFRGTGGSVSDIDSWKKKLDAANSPEQFKGVMNQMTELLGSRLDALGQQYNQGMGTTKNGIELLSPKAQAAYAKITGAKAPETAVSGNLQADNAKADSNPSGITKEQALAELKRRGKIK